MKLSLIKIIVSFVQVRVIYVDLTQNVLHAIIRLFVRALKQESVTLTIRALAVI